MKRTQGAAARLFVATCALYAVCAQTTIFAAEESEAKLDPLAWRSDLAIWTAVVFFLLVVVLTKFAFGPIVKALDKRERDELDRLASTEKANADAKALLELYRQKIEGSEEEVRNILGAAKADAERRANQLIAEAKDAAQSERERAVEEIRAASEAALNELAATSAELAANLAGKIIQEEIDIDPSKRERLISNAVESLTR